MKYRINMVGTWLPFLIMLPYPMMLINLLKLSNLYAMIFTGIDVAYFVFLFIWVLRLSRNFRFLIMGNGALVFSKCTIHAGEIKKVIVNQRTGVMTLYRKGHKIPLVIGVRLLDKVYFLSEIEEWLKTNEVKTSVIAVRKHWNGK